MESWFPHPSPTPARGEGEAECAQYFRAQIALAWVPAKSPITAPIVGATKTSHLEDAVAALKIKLDEDEITALESPYVPHQVMGFV